MKSQELIISQRKELADGLQELITLIDKDTIQMTEDTKIFLYSGLAMIRVMDWSLDDSELEFEEYAISTNEDISKEFNFEKIGDKVIEVVVNN